MVFTTDELTWFFTNVPKMALYVDTRAWLYQDELVTVESFEDFKIDQLDN